MSLFGFYFVTSVLSEAGWPRKQGLLGRKIFDATIADAILDQLPDWAAGIGASASTAALQALTQVLTDRTELGISISKLIQNVREIGPVDGPPPPHFRFTEIYGQSFTSDQLKDRKVILELEKVFVGSLLWGLALPQRFRIYYISKTHQSLAPSESMRKLGLQVEALPDLPEFIQHCEQIMKNYERDFTKLPSVPPSVWAEARQLGISPFEPGGTINKDDASAAFKRAFEPGEERNQIDGATGQFGYERTNPIPADGNWYCRRLRCPAGHPYWYHRLGSVGPGPDHHIVDHLELQCFGGESRVKLFFDMYHVGASPLVPLGLSMGSEAGRGSTRGLASPFPEGLDGYDSSINLAVNSGTTRSVGPSDRVPLTKLLVHRHEDGWAAAVIDMGEGKGPLRFMAGIMKVGTKPLWDTPFTVSDFYEDLGRARHASDQLLRKWTNHTTCSTSCRGWMEIGPSI